ncbi:MAG: beta-glucosidase BglX, partial [Flavitalea sp.]
FPALVYAQQPIKKAPPKNQPVQQNTQKMNAYITNLMNKMTVEEKIGQLNLPSVGFDVTGPIVSQGVEEKIQKGLVGGVFNTFTPVAVRKLQEMAVTKSRLKIPLLFGYDVIHGHRTIFPISLGLAASWDMDLVERTARAAAEEASADGLNWTFSPMVDIARDPRWGRVSEGAGEDPFLGSAVARAMIYGYQGNDLSKDNTVLACVKHFALYGASEAGRDYNTTDMSRLRMFNEYFAPYKASIDAGVGSVMSSFNEIDGVPASANSWIMTDLLRKQWGFKGLVVSDYTAINEMINHGIGDGKEVARRGLKAGTEMDMVGELYITHLPQLVKEGKVSMAEINNACRLILEAKYKLGLFDDPYRYVNEARNKSEIMNEQKLALAKEAAIKSFVLLKNDNALPLLSTKTIAFVGPLVKNQRDLIGSWSGAGDWKQAISIWDALQNKFRGNPFLYAKGCNFVDDEALMAKLNPHGAQLVKDSSSPQELIDEAVAVAGKADVIVAVLGEPYGMTGEAASRSSIGLLPNQMELLKALKKTGKKIVLVLMNGRPMDLSWEDQNVDAILETWYGGTKAGEAIADVLFGEANPSGKITMTYPRNLGQVPIYYNHKMTGRPFDANQKYTTKYLDVANTPLYPFGYGLSYTKFNYSDMSLSSATMQKGGTITAKVTLSNSGTFNGVETVQLYIRDLVGSITRPVKELKGFQQVSLKAGESKTISFTIKEEDLKFYNADLKWVSEPGEFEVFIGGSSAIDRGIKFELK